MAKKKTTKTPVAQVVRKVETRERIMVLGPTGKRRMEWRDK